MKKTSLVIAVILLISNGACSQLESSGSKTSVQSTTVDSSILTPSLNSSTNKPLYLNGQVEWIARSFSPECRIKKNQEDRVGG
jgi:hypothetical protein